MIFWGEYRNIVNRKWNMMIRLCRVKRYLPLATLHVNKHLTLDWGHVPPKRITSTKYHSVFVTSRVNIRNKTLIPLIPGSNRLQGEVQGLLQPIRLMFTQLWQEVMCAKSGMMIPVICCTAIGKMMETAQICDSIHK